MTLNGVEFLRRFLLHVLPTGFVRIRSFGWLANRGRAQNLARCRQLLAPAPSTAVPKAEAPKPAKDEPQPCAVCGIGRLWCVGVLAPAGMPGDDALAPTRRDTS